MAEQVTKEGAWRRMPEYKQNRYLHLGMSLLTIVVTLAGILGGYWSNQAATAALIARLETKIDAQSTRLSTLEAARQTLEAAFQSDRLSIERRVTALETYYSQTNQMLGEIRADVRSLRDRALPNP